MKKGKLLDSEVQRKERLIKRSHVWSQGALFVGLLILLTALLQTFMHLTVVYANVLIKFVKFYQLEFDSTMHDFE